MDGGDGLAGRSRRSYGALHMISLRIKEVVQKKILTSWKRSIFGGGHVGARVRVGIAAATSRVDPEGPKVDCRKSVWGLKHL